MIKDRIKYTSTVYFSPSVPLFSLSYYDFCFDERNQFWFKKQEFQSLRIDLQKSEEELLQGYVYNHRKNAKRGKASTLFFKTHQEAHDFSHLQKYVVEEVSGVSYRPRRLLSASPVRIFTAIYEDDEPGKEPLAFHTYLIDKEEKIAMLMMNVSTHRKYKNPTKRQSIGRANVYLFHRDFMYFKDQGFHYVDFGGYVIPSLKVFKRGFGGEIVQYSRYSPRVWVLLKKVKNYISGKK